MTRRVRVGIVGTGFGMRVLLPAFRSDRRCEVTSVCASTMAHARKAARDHRIERAFGDWKKTASDPSLDVLAISVPANLQPKIACLALRHKKSLFCEKPVSASLKDARAMAQAAQKVRVTNVVDFEFSEAPAFLEAKRLLAQKKLGRIRHAVLSWHIETYVNRNRLRSWKNEAGKGGGALRAFVSHSFHYLEWLLGPVDAVNVRLRKAEGLRGSGDSLAMIRLRFIPGFYANLTVSTHAVHGSGHHLEIYGDKGALRLELGADEPLDAFRLYFAARRDKAPRRIRLPVPKTSDRDSRVGAVSSLVRRFISGVLGRKSIRPDLQDGLRVQTLIDAASRSDAMAGRAVFLPGV